MTATGGLIRFVAPSLPLGDVHPARGGRTGQAEHAGAPALAGAGGFTTVATAVLRGRGLGLSTGAKLLYVVLRSYAAPDGTCFPGYERLQGDVGCGVNQLTGYVRELEAVGLLSRRRRGQGKPTLYTVHAPATPAPESAQTHRRRESRLTAPVTLGSPPEGAEQDSADPDSGEQHQPASAAQLAPTPCDVGEPPGAGDDVALVDLLISRGITRRIARTLVRDHGAGAVREQLAWHPYRPPAKNPAGALVQAIRDAWPSPQAWVEAQERAAAGARQAEEERRRQQEEEACQRAWAAKSPEERIAGRLQFWVMGRRAKRHEPTAAEIAARRAELLAELAAAPPAGGVS